MNPFQQQLRHCLSKTDFPQLGEKYQGKVRDVYRRDDRLTLIATDRLSAFDRVLTTLPFKGQILNQLAQFWFERTAHVVRNHILDVPHPNVTVARACEAIPVEWVVRGYLTGSLWRDYQRGAHTAYGLSLPPGLRKDSRFEMPIVTPTSKAAVGEHDLPMTPSAVIARIGRWDYERAKEAALELFAEGQRWAQTRGLLLVDTKYEFGKVGDVLYVIDEIHTPDSSRFWEAAEYEWRWGQGEDQRMLDKENLRQWLLRERGFSGHGPTPDIPDDVRVQLAQTYATAFERITGRLPEFRVGDVEASIRTALQAGKDV